jgi:hypothetical protein
VVKASDPDAPRQRPGSPFHLRGEARAAVAARRAHDERIAEGAERALEVGRPVVAREEVRRHARLRRQGRGTQPANAEGARRR